MKQLWNVGFRIPIAILIISTVSSCGTPPEPPEPPEPVGFHEAIQKADQVILYEGLPHQYWDRELLQKELKTKKTVEILKYPFYAETLEMDASDQKRITEIFSDPGMLKKWSGEKKCGGFHPDYAVQWRIGDTRYTVLVCFGCSEFKLQGPDGESRHDIGGDRSLRTILRKYVKNRPKGSGGKS